jgi:hypothetical protein
MEDEFKTILGMLPFLIPLFILEIGLLVFALLDIIKRKRVRGNNKIIWILIIVFVEIIGSIIYLAIGRQEEIIDSDKD